MLFNSLDFAVFLPIVFLLYWFVLRQRQHQNILIVVASYIFYGWWDWRFLGLIAFSSVLDFFVGQQLQKTEEEKKRKLLLAISMVVNLGLLGFFKYSNFFIENFVQAFSLFGRELNIQTLKIILPVGISFYTFQTMSYTIDVYRKKLKATDDFISFAAFVSFFPQLVAGPIERATHLLPQFYKDREFDIEKAKDGLRHMLWGLFKKMVIADNCAAIANYIFNDSDNHSGSTLVLGAIMFTFQIYGDFSGYSDIAIGVSRLFGFDLNKNFATPYFSRDIAEFWRRWHISLSTWFRDYLYIPLGGSRGGTNMRLRNTFAIFLVSGFWHGANWTFIVWGLLNALYFLPLLLLDKNRSNLGVVAEGKLLPSFREVIAMTTTFIMAVFAWIFFRAEDLGHAFSYISGIFDASILSKPDAGQSLKNVSIAIVFFMSIEWLGREYDYGLQRVRELPKVVRWAVYYFLIFLIFYLQSAGQEFIYFQF